MGFREERHIELPRRRIWPDSGDGNAQLATGPRMDDPSDCAHGLVGGGLGHDDLPGRPSPSSHFTPLN